MTDSKYADLLHAARKRQRAEEEYRDELEILLATGETYVKLARVLGISRQAVRQYVERGAKT